VSVALSFLIYANQTSAKHWITVPRNREAGLPRNIAKGFAFFDYIDFSGLFFRGLLSTIFLSRC
jgi:hypothetical protein